MSTCLSLKKRFMELITNSKGFSSVIGTTFMVLVMMFLGTSVFLWTLSQNTIYNEEVRARNLEEAERIEEHVVATLIGNYTVSGDQVSFLAKLTNTGSVAVQIIRLWVFDGDPSNPRYTDKSLDLKLNPGDVLNPALNDTTVHLPGAVSNHTFVSWFVTARGNTIPLETEKEEEEMIYAQVTQGIGAIAMDFDTFVYYNVDYVSGNYRLRKSQWPNGTSGYSIPSGTNIAFRVTFTNYDRKQRSITLNSHSVLWMIFPATAQQPRSCWWYVISVDADGIIAETYTNLILPYNVSTSVFFASADDYSFGPSSIAAPINPNQPAAVNLMLIGTFDGGEAFGQNVPFVSVYVTEP